MSDSEYILLNWKDDNSFFVKELNFLQEEFTDCTIVCEEKFFKSHKILLSIWSPYLKSIFLNVDVKYPVIVLKEIKSEDFENILKFIYQGHICIKVDEVQSLIATSDFLKIKLLSSININQNNFQIQDISSNTPSNSNLTSSINTIIKSEDSNLQSPIVLQSNNNEQSQMKTTISIEMKNKPTNINRKKTESAIFEDFSISEETIPHIIPIIISNESETQKSPKIKKVANSPSKISKQSKQLPVMASSSTAITEKKSPTKTTQIMKFPDGKDPEEYLKCPKCFKQVKRKSMPVHIKRTHLKEGERIICKICSATLKNKGIYYKHMHEHKKNAKR